MRGLAVDRLEDPPELRGRQVSDRRQVGDVERLGVAPGGPVECQVQVRAHGGIADGVAELRDGRLVVDLRAPIRGVASGQTMVLYRPDPDGDEVLGSATITR